MFVIKAKLGRMRKPQEFVIYPKQDDPGHIIIQSDKSIGRFDRNTGKGVLNTRGCYFVHLNKILGAEPYEFSMEFVRMCEEIQLGKGDLIGSSPETGPVYVA